MISKELYRVMRWDIMDDGGLDRAGQGGQPERNRGNRFQAKQCKLLYLTGAIKFCAVSN
jgi:hypothetical protein